MRVLLREYLTFRMKTFKQYLVELEDQKPFDPKLAYHDTLNPDIWDNFELRPEVSDALEKIANEFINFLGIDLAAVTDVILTGSNANYNWTDISDIDLHVVIDMKNGQICPTCPSDDFISDCFQSKKTLWNASHNITIHGFDVELYAQNAAETAVQDSGVYSLRSKQWIQEPLNKQITIDNKAVQLKSQDLMLQIDELIDSQSDNRSELQDIKDRIKKLRSAGLQKGGEFSIENLAFKALRNLGYIEKLTNYMKNLADRDLSI